MKVLVTGTAGFIGFHVAKRLLDRGDTVVGFDCFNNYYDVAIKEDRNHILEKYPLFRVVRGKLEEKQDVDAVFSSEKFDAVVNLAAQAGVRYSLTNPEVYMSSNITGFLNILEGCRHFGIKKLVYASSSSVYGGNTKMPFSESDRVDTPVSLYAASKKSNELMAHCYSHLFGFQTIGLRFFTVYGPWGRPDMAMWLFAEAIRKGEAIKVFNHGEMKRDFTFVDDIVSGIVGCVDAQNLPQYEIFNLGNHRSERLLDMIQLIEKEMGAEAKKEFLPLQPGDVPASFADVDHAKELIGYEPTTPISVGIPKFVKWYKEYNKIPG